MFRRYVAIHGNSRLIELLGDYLSCSEMPSKRFGNANIAC